MLQGPTSGEDTLDGESDDQECFQYAEPLAPPPSVENIPRPLSPTKLTPMVHSPLRYQSDADLEVLRKKLANAPRPLKKRSSITEPEGPNGPNIQKLLYQRFNTLAGGIEGSGVSGSGGSSGAGTGTPFYQPTIPPAHFGSESTSDTDNGNLPTEALLPPPGVEEEEGSEAPVPSPDANDNEPLPLSPDALGSPAEAEGPEDDDNNNVVGSIEALLPSPVPEVSTPQESSAALSQALVTDTYVQIILCTFHKQLCNLSVLFLLLQGKRTNLKKPNSDRTGHSFRVKFNPLALLLDASLEGEFDLVQRIIYEVYCECFYLFIYLFVCSLYMYDDPVYGCFSQVDNPSTPNDEGITPLHNAVCAGHHHIVKFLLDFGVNVNAADSDGW